MGYICLVRDDPKPWVDDLMEKYESYRLYYKRILGGACKVVNMLDRLTGLTLHTMSPSQAWLTVKMERILGYLFPFSSCLITVSPWDEREVVVVDQAFSS